MGKAGKLYIFSMSKFKDPNMNLKGTGEDIRNLQHAFNMFNANVVSVYKDFSKEQIRATMDEIKHKNFEKYGYIVVAITTHGDQGHHVWARDRIFCFDDEVVFPILSNKSLRHKPKLFIIDACKGHFPMRHRRSRSRSLEDVSYLIPRENPYPGNCVRCYSSTEGWKSYQNSSFGGDFIREFCKYLEKYGNHMSVVQVMEHTKQRMVDKKMQRPSIENEMTSSESAAFVLGKLKTKHW